MRVGAHLVRHKPALVIQPFPRQLLAMSHVMPPECQLILES